MKESGHLGCSSKSQLQAVPPTAPSGGKLAKSGRAANHGELPWLSRLCCGDDDPTVRTSGAGCRPGESGRPWQNRNMERGPCVPRAGFASASTCQSIRSDYWWRRPHFRCSWNQPAGPLEFLLSGCISPPVAEPKIPLNATTGKALPRNRVAMRHEPGRGRRRASGRMQTRNSSRAYASDLGATGIGRVLRRN